MIDGDTIDMTGTRIRLAYIDAPETRQNCDREGEEWACGKAATEALISILNGSQVFCRVIDTDVYGRQVAQCQTSVFELGHEMLRRGMAVASDNAPYEYDEATGIAQRMASGLWASSFDLPAEWRAEHSQDRPHVAPPMPQSTLQSRRRERVYRGQHGCAIKGNRSRRGNWIYHLPGRPYYDQTRPEEVFCTESEAQAAGYRRSKA